MHEPLYYGVYAEVNILCILMLLYVLWRISRRMTPGAEVRAFNRVVVATLAILALDLGWALVDGRPGFRAVHQIINALYMLDSVLISYLWVLYSERVMRGMEPFVRWKVLLAGLPVLITAVLGLCSLKTGWLYVVDANNAYHRGPLRPLQLLTCNGYLIVEAARVLLRARKQRGRQRRSELLLLASFFILPITGGLLANFFEGLPTTWPATSLSLIMVYVTLQVAQISTDGLTGLNNRRQFDRSLTAATEEFPKEHRLFLLMLDINAFKRINDTFGHLEGDAALVYTAQLLKELCRTRDAMLARYGGDEFAILAWCDAADEAEGFRQEIMATFEHRGAQAGKEYHITVSCGCAEFAPDCARTARELVEQADGALYETKRLIKELAGKVVSPAPAPRA